jgi:ATP-dependent DNA helicase RecG
LRAESESLRTEFEPLRSELPSGLRTELDQIGKRVTPEELNAIVVKLCRWKSLSLPELAALTGKTASHLRTRVLRRLLADNRIGTYFSLEARPASRTPLPAS